MQRESGHAVQVRCPEDSLARSWSSRSPWCSAGEVFPRQVPPGPRGLRGVQMLCLSLFTLTQECLLALLYIYEDLWLLFSFFDLFI